MKNKELVIGAIIVFFFNCFLMIMIADISQMEDFASFLPNLSLKTRNIIGIALTGLALLGIGFGIWLLNHETFEEINKKITFTAKIPGILIFAASPPVIYGLILVLFLEFDFWGFTLMCLMVPATILFLILLVRKENKNT